MTIEKLSEFRQLFDELSIYDKTNKVNVLILNEAREAISKPESTYLITCDEFNAFFGLHQGHLINENEFSELVSKFEDELLNIAGVS